MGTKIEPLDERKLLNAGLCALMSVDGSDLTPAIAARTSYRDFVEEHSEKDNENLVDYLIRKRHDTPIEFAGATFYMILPIFCARQFVRHRTVSLNEESLRYVEARKEFYIPSIEECKSQSLINKQGSSNDLIAYPETAISMIEAAGDSAHITYNALLHLELSKELSRTVLPLGQYTAWYWKANLRNIFHMLHLRDDNHAQSQIRVYASAMLEMLQPYFPNTIAAWNNHVHSAITFSRDECDILKELIDTALCFSSNTKAVDLDKLMKTARLRKTRQAEFLEKIKKLG